jgi:cell division septum initiation protein DivIVA
VGAVRGLPNLEGDIDEMIDVRPVFRARMHGYDRLEVDNYTAWAERELLAAWRQADHLLSRFGECSAELELSRRLLAEAARGRDPFPISDRLQEMLRLAADEAAAITEAGEKEADRLVAEARTEADATLRKAHEVKELAIVAAHELKEQGRLDRADATATLERARAEAATMLRKASAECDRLAVEAAQEREHAAEAAAVRLAAVQAQVDELHREQQMARESLRSLTDMLSEALRSVGAMMPDVPAGADAAADGTGTHRDHRDGPTVAVLAGGPAPFPD